MRDPIFSARFGRRGYWSPRRFLEDASANIYFLEPFDPKRKPVLFIHGAAGSPVDWSFLFEHLDNQRYQAWFFHYPSGAPIDSLAAVLRHRLVEIARQLSVTELHIVAHSLGGLLTQTALESWAPSLPRVRRFVAISTPWGGIGAARMAPSYVKAWRDMRPLSPFLSSLFRKPLPPECEFYLFFGHKGPRSLLRHSNDGIVSLRSSLSPAAQAAATRVLGFDEDHVSILSSPEVVQALHSVLG